MPILFDRFTLDPEARRLLDAGREVHLSPKAFDVLETLIDRRPAVVTKSELQERVWPGTFVVDATLNVVIAEIRRVLQDDAAAPRFIRTVHRVGYAFCAEAGPPASRGTAPRARCWVTWSDRTVQLVEGENLIGRDPRCEVWVDASGVSRRHARLLVSGDVVTLEDLGSKNGTFVAGKALLSPRRLDDGDVILVGSTALKFRIWSDERAPQTERLARGRSRPPEKPQ